MWRLLLIILALSGCQAAHNTNVAQAPYSDQTDPPSLYQIIFNADQDKSIGQLDSALKGFKEALAITPDSNYLNQEIASILFAQNERDAAIDVLAQFIKNNKANKQTKVLLAKLYLTKGQVDEAISVYDSLIIDTNDLESLTSRASLYFQQGKKVEAFHDLDLVLKADNSFFPALITYARILVQDKQFAKSITYYKRALKKDFDTQIGYEFASLLLKRDKYAIALPIYNDILKYKPNDDLAFGLKYICLIKLEKNSEADSLLERRRSISNNPEELDSIIANYLISVKSNSEAKEILHAMLTRYKSNRAILTLALLEYQENNYEVVENLVSQINSDSNEYLLGQELELQIYLKTEQNEKGVKKLDYLIETFTQKPQWYLTLATFHSNQKNSSKTESVYLKAQSAFPNNSDISFQYAIFLNNQKRTSDAISIMEQVLINDPENAQALNFVGYSWAEEGINLNKALEYTLKASKLSPGNGYILDSVGWCYYQLEQYPEALEKLLTANDLTKDDPSILEHIGDTYMKLHNKQKASGYYRKSLHLKNSTDNDINALKEKINLTLDGI